MAFYRNTARDGFVVTPSDTEDFAVDAGALIVVSGGDVTIVTVAGTEIPFPATPAYYTIPFKVRRVLVTGTNATNIIAAIMPEL